jgi:tRNA(fMet)-specific endonuclease VapC
MGYLLDTNIVSAIFKNNPKVIIELDNLRTQGEKLFISGMTYYEIQRGFLIGLFL